MIHIFSNIIPILNILAKSLCYTVCTGKSEMENEIKFISISAEWKSKRSQREGKLGQNQEINTQLD